MSSGAVKQVASDFEVSISSAHTQPTRFTARQISRSLGISRQAVQQALASVPQDGEVIVQGKPAAAWRFSSLPLDWQLEITRQGVGKGFANGSEYLQSLPATSWVPPLPWSALMPRQQEKAVKLQKALLSALELRDAGTATAAAVELALEDFQREFGYSVSGRQIRRLLNRTIERDGGEENWQRLEIYLDERAFTKPKVCRLAVRREYLHRELDEAFELLESRVTPTAEDRQFLWDRVFRHYEAKIEGILDTPSKKREIRSIKASLVHYLVKAFPPGTLCASEKSLRRRFEEKLNLWRDGGRVPQVIADHRPENSGQFPHKQCAACRPLVVGGAVDLDGDLSQAWRRLQLGRQLCQQCAEIGSFDVRSNKSEVPKSVRADVTPDILAALPYRRGPKHVRLVSPYVRRDWGDIGPGDWAECDDMTPNHVTHGLVEAVTWDTDKNGRPYIGRMEVLVQIDRRTDYPWAYVIILGDPATIFSPQRKATYNSVHCRLLFLRAHDQLGIPHAGGGYVLENGVWASRLIDGPKMADWESTPWKRMEMGLQDPRIGLSVHHAIAGNPRSKVIERVFLAVQNRMRCLPGFVGFNERQDKRERMDDFIRRVKAGKEHPGNEVPSITEFRNLLDSELMAHAQEPQNGERLPGVSPMEAFQNGIGGKLGIKDRPLRQLGANARFMLSTHERLAPVTAQGIKYKVGGAEFVFWGPELEGFKHKEIIARFNFEEPELLTCQPPNGEPFTVRARKLPSSTATKEQMEEAGRARASWTRQGKVIFDNLPHPFRSTVTRDNDQTHETQELGRFHNAEVEKFREEKTALKRQTRKARQAAVAAGFAPSHLRMKNPERVAEAVERIPSRLEALRQREAIEGALAPETDNAE